MEYVKRACSYVVDLLSDQDMLSIVTFEETVEVLMPPRKIVNKLLVKEHLNRGRGLGEGGFETCAFTNSGYTIGIKTEESYTLART